MALREYGPERPRQQGRPYRRRVWQPCLPFQARLTRMYFLFASMGNDSIALIKYFGMKWRNGEVHVLYTNTGWASEEWPARVEKGFALARHYGFDCVELFSEGMESLVLRKKGWPMPASNMQFCTGELKIRPAMNYMDTVDPKREWICVNGVRRAESANRSDTPLWVESSERHGGRTLWSPLAMHTDEQRNQLLEHAGFGVLPHRSRECFPCISGKRETLRDLTEAKLVQIEGIEQRMGNTSKGKPRSMFRPYRHMGATGIREVKAWADAEPGQYGKGGKDWPEEQMCLAGFCGE